MLLYFINRFWHRGLRAGSGPAPVERAEVMANAGSPVVVLHLRRPRVPRLKMRGVALGDALAKDRFEFQ